MTYRETAETDLMRPEYWGGIDITQAQQFAAAQTEPGIYLSKREYNRASRQLEQALGLVAAGNITEVDYRMGTEFSPQLDDGTVVVIDSERLAHGLETFGSRPEAEVALYSAPAISRPFSAYWLANQPRPQELGGVMLGWDRVDISERDTMYKRSLTWGVLATHRRQRVLQPYTFNMVRLHPDGRVTAPKDSGSEILNGSALPLPVRVGEVSLISWEGRPGAVQHILDRVRGISVVHPVVAERRGSRASRSAAGRLSPRWASGAEPA